MFLWPSALLPQHRAHGDLSDPVYLPWVLAPWSAEALFSLSEEDTEIQLPFSSEGDGVGFKAKHTHVL